MRNWYSWIWPGIVTVACITALALWFRAEHIERALRTDALSALGGGFGWASVNLEGRDLNLSGIAPDESAQNNAVRILRGLVNIRAVLDNSILLPLESPYGLVGEKTAEGIRISGFVPDQATKNALAERMSGILPGLAFRDETRLARGAPDILLDLAGFGMQIFSRFSTGSFRISDRSIAINGRALTAEEGELALRMARETLPAGAILNEVVVTPGN